MDGMLPVLAVLLAAVCFGTTGTAQALAAVAASPIAVGAARILVGGGVLGGIALGRRGRSGRVPPALAGAGPSRLRSAALLVLGAVGVLAYQPMFFYGTRHNGVAVGTVIALGSAPVLTGAIDALLRRRAPSLRWLAATALALIGVALVSGVVQDVAAGDPIASPLGVLASIGAGASYAAYTLAGKGLLDLGWGSEATMGGMFGLAAVISVPVLLLAGGDWLLTVRGVVLVLWLGVVTTAVAYLLFGWGLARLSAPVVSTLTIAEPLTAAILGTAVLHERIDAVGIVGMAVLLAGLMLLTVPAGRRLRRPRVGG